MKRNRPDVTIENHQEVYEYYRDFTPNKRAAKLTYAALGAIAVPRVSFVNDAEAQLEHELDRDTAPLVIFNHLSFRDPLLLAGVVRQTALRGKVGDIRAFAMDPLFHNPIARRIVDNCGAVPMFRTKDNHGKPVTAAAYEASAVGAHFLLHGQPLAMSPEGGINRTDDPSRIMKIRKGIAHTILRARDLGGDPHIIPLGMSYGPEHALRHANIIVGEPLTDIPDDVNGIIHAIGDHLQAVTTQAFETY